MRLEPVGHRVIIKPCEIETGLGVTVSEDLKKLGFVVQAGLGEEERVKMATDRGIVTAVGPMAWKHPDYGYGTLDWEPWAKVGDEVIFAKYAGKVVVDPDDGVEYFVINDEDVQVKIKEA